MKRNTAIPSLVSATYSSPTFLSSGLLALIAVPPSSSLPPSANVLKMTSAPFAAAFWIYRNEEQRRLAGDL